MPANPLSRRELLERCLALGTVTIAAPVSVPAAATAWQQHEKSLPPTPFCELGPFYKRLAPKTGSLRGPSDPGLPLSVAGRVFSVRGDALPEAVIEVWQADHLGRYDNEGYSYRARLRPNGKGKYEFDSVMPGHYPARVCQHIHYLVIAPGHKPLTTQLYFATDPAFEGDPDKNYGRDPLITSRELVRPVTLTGDPQKVLAAVHFDIVLEKL